jgi:protein dithiol oxidoreductase (disulfide-forming)
MLRRIFFASLLLAPLTLSAQIKPGVPVAGKDYIVLSTAQPTWGTGGIEVAEVFSYSCVHCAEFQPLVNAWKKKLPTDVRFVYVPAVFGGIWDNTARAYFAAEALGVQAKTHDAIFKAFFIDRKIKTGSVEELAGIYAGLGVDRKKMLDTMNGFTVSSKLNRARQFALRAGVDSTPSIIVNGKYRVTARSLESSLQVADFLVQKERAANKAK